MLNSLLGLINTDAKGITFSHYNNNFFKLFLQKQYLKNVNIRIIQVLI